MIVATAGHVDHGKTSLIRALTGVDTDRLEEEKRRGLSINLGYAYLPCEADVPLGFIDVPGHRRFINTMIAGISGIDLGMLVVAADDGIMPQTREHLDVLRLLGIEKVLLVITKIDRVEKARVEEVAGALDACLEGLELHPLGTYPVDNVTREGLEALKNVLLAAAKDHTEGASRGCFRLAIDRAFTIKGAGVVVTGTAQSGYIAVGDSLNVFPGGQKVRVRSLRVHDTEAEEAMGGQRCAINIAGDVAVEQVPRGSWLLSPACGPASAVLDVDVRLLDSAPFALKHLAPVKVHLGSTRVAGRLALVARTENENTLHAGRSAIAQLRLDEPLPAFRGQRFVLRDHAENLTIGGGQVLRPSAAQRKLGQRQLDELAAHQEPVAEVAAQALVQMRGVLELDSFAWISNLSVAESESLAQSLHAEGRRLFEHEGVHFVASPTHWKATEQNLVQMVEAWHRDHPRDPGLKAARIRSLWQPVDEMPLVTAVLGSLIKSQQLQLREGNLALPNFAPARSGKIDKHWEQYQQLLREGGTHIPLLSEINKQTNISIEDLRRAADMAVKEGRAFKVSDRRYALPATLLQLCNAVLELHSRGDEITVISVKNEWSLGRNIAVEIVEFLDGIRFTARRGDERIVLDETLPERLFGQSP